MEYDSHAGRGQAHTAELPSLNRGAFSATNRSGTGLRAAIGIALAADTLSIAVMEIVDTAIVVGWPTAMDAGHGH